jgi:hypothetical protein
MSIPGSGRVQVCPGVDRPGRPRAREAHPWATYPPIEELTVRVPLAKPVRVVRSVEHGPLPFTEERAAPALRGQGYHSVAVFTTRLGLNDIILLE